MREKISAYMNTGLRERVDLKRSIKIRTFAVFGMIRAVMFLLYLVNNNYVFRLPLREFVDKELRSSGPNTVI